MGVALSCHQLPRASRCRWDHPAHPAPTADQGALLVLTKDPDSEAVAVWHMQLNSGPRTPPPAYSAEIAPTWIAAASTHNVMMAPHHHHPCRCLLQLSTVHNSQTLRLIIDTGASVNLVEPMVLSQTDPQTDIAPIGIRGVAGQRQTLTRRTALTLDIHNHPYAFEMHIAPELPVHALLGLDAIIEAGWVVDAIHRQLIHVYHALPPIPLAPCPHTALLAYTVQEVTLPPRAWKHIAVSTETDLSVATEADTLPSLRANCCDREVFVRNS